MINVASVYIIDKGYMIWQMLAFIIQVYASALETFLGISLYRIEN